MYLCVYVVCVSSVFNSLLFFFIGAHARIASYLLLQLEVPYCYSGLFHSSFSRLWGYAYSPIWNKNLFLSINHGGRNFFFCLKFAEIICWFWIRSWTTIYTEHRPGVPTLYEAAFFIHVAVVFFIHIPS